MSCSTSHLIIITDRPWYTGADGIRRGSFTLHEEGSPSEVWTRSREHYGTVHVIGKGSRRRTMREAFERIHRTARIAARGCYSNPTIEVVR